MKLRKIVLFVGLMAVLTLLIVVPQVLAGAGPEPPPPGSTILDTELWGVVVVYCSNSTPDFVVVRVKRVVGCNVETQTLIEPAWTFGCPASASEPLDWSLPAGMHFFDIVVGNPYIAKVKNYKHDVQANGDAYSFDAQFKFWTY